jgi:hypothetical protein
VGADVVGVDLQLRSNLRQLVGEEDVGPGHKLEEKGPACSTLMTSAPHSARIAAAAGTKVRSATSTIRIPAMTSVIRPLP